MSSYDTGYAAAILSEYYSESYTAGARGFDTSASTMTINSLPRTNLVNMKATLFPSVNKSSATKSSSRRSRTAAHTRTSLTATTPSFKSSYDVTAYQKPTLFVEPVWTRPASTDGRKRRSNLSGAIRPQTSQAYESSRGGSAGSPRSQARENQAGDQASVADSLSLATASWFGPEASVVLPNPTYGSLDNEDSLFGESFLSSVAGGTYPNYSLTKKNKKNKNAMQFQKSYLFTPPVTKHVAVSSDSPILHKLAYPYANVTFEGSAVSDEGKKSPVKKKTKKKKKTPQTPPEPLQEDSLLEEVVVYDTSAIDREMMMRARELELIAHRERQLETAASLRQQAMWAGMSNLMSGFEESKEQEEGRKLKAYVGGFVRAVVKAGVEKRVSPSKDRSRKEKRGDEEKGEGEEQERAVSPQDKMKRMRDRLRTGESLPE
jgi:hypothetical protein